MDKMDKIDRINRIWKSIVRERNYRVIDQKIEKSTVTITIENINPVWPISEFSDIEKELDVKIYIATVQNWKHEIIIRLL